MDNEKKKTNRPNNVARIPCSLSDSFFRYWFMFWEPFHKLTKREIDVAATLVKIRYELSKVVKDEIILDKLVMSEDTKKRVREECNIQTQHFQVIMSNLRKHKVIVNGKINPLVIPRIKEGDDTLQLLFLFDFSQDK